MGRCAKLAWEHAVEAHAKQVSRRPRPGVMTGHLLVGVLKEPDCAGGLILEKMGLNLDLARRHAEFVLMHGSRRDGVEEATVDWEGVPHTPAARRVLEYCLEEATLTSDTFPIGTEHLVIALLRVPEGIGSDVLRYFGIEHEFARATRDNWWNVLNLRE
jgi:ATP-dependent Clp protease ATP-binding subunit ClpA